MTRSEFTLRDTFDYNVSQNAGPEVLYSMMGQLWYD